MSSPLYQARSAFHVSLWVWLLLILGTLPMAGSSALSQQSVPSLELKSSSFSGDTIPDMYAGSRENCPCDGHDISPELSWAAPPERTQSFALIVTDKDSPFGFHFVHWVIYDLPADKRELSQGVPKQEQLPDGSRQGRNGFAKIGYVGPCPPGHSAHRYVFVLYALDTMLDLPPGASKKQLEKAMKGHVLASGELVGKYQH